MRWLMQPLGPWTDPVTAVRRSRYTFKAPWSDTKALLAYEVDLLGGEQIVLQVDVRPEQIRQDGEFRANTSVGPFPGVRVSFVGDRGPLTFASDAHETWQHNVRAIALALQALRAVDRYGVSQRGQQYTGWTAIESRPAEMTPDVAAGLLAEWSGLTETDVRRNPAFAWRQAAKRAHPDLTGDDGDTMARLNAARTLLVGVS